MRTAPEAIKITQLDDLYFESSALGLYLREERIAQRLSLRDLERQTGVSDSEIHKLETGSQECRLSSFILICSALGVPPGLALDQVVLSSWSFFQSRIQEDPRFEELCRERWKEQSSVWRALAGQLAMFCSIAAHLLRSSNAIRRAKSFRYPTDELRKTFTDFAELVEQTGTGVETANILKALLRRPFAELQTLRLIEFGLLDKLASGREETLWSPIFDSAWHYYQLQETRRRPTNEDLIQALQKKLDDEHDKQYLMTPTMKQRSSWKSLRRRLRAATSERGAQAEVARRLKVTPQAVSEWLAGESAPTANNTLRIIDLLDEAEAKQQKQSAGSVSEARPTLKRSKLRRNSKYEKQTSSDRRRNK